MKKSWESLEELIAKNIRGKRTPGSGNGRVKGDIIATDLEGLEWGIEAKDTEQTTLVLQYKWFTELERDCKNRDGLALIIRYGRDIKVYTGTECREDCKFPTVWRTKNISSMEDFPPTVYTKYYRWTTQDFSEFTSLFV